MVSLACDKAKDHGYLHELWTTRLLARHARENASAAGHECLAKLVRGTVCKILGQKEIKPHKVRYYLERRDAEFEQKMAEVLCVYREVQVLKKAAKSQNPNGVGFPASASVFTKFEYLILNQTRTAPRLTVVFRKESLLFLNTQQKLLLFLPPAQWNLMECQSRACARLFAPAALFSELPSRAVNRFCGPAVSSNANVQTKMLP